MKIFQTVAPSRLFIGVISINLQSINDRLKNHYLDHLTAVTNMGTENNIIGVRGCREVNLDEISFSVEKNDEKRRAQLEGYTLVFSAWKY